MSQKIKSNSESTNYNEIQLKIKSLSAEIRSRPGMYFGDVHIKSFAHLLRTIVIDVFEQVGAINFSLSLYDEWKIKMRFEGISKTVDNHLIDPSRVWEQYHFTELHFLNPACIEIDYWHLASLSTTARSLNFIPTLTINESGTCLEWN